MRASAGLPVQRSIIVRSAVDENGFARSSSIPAATQASRSPGIALPVSAAMGTRVPGASAAPISRAAASPVHHGHQGIHQDQHEVGVRGRAITPSWPLDAVSAWKPSMSSIARAIFLA